MAYKPRFGSKKREDLWAREKLHAYLNGRGDHPICNICDEPVTPDQAWDESHEGAPKALGGKSVGVGHRKCNRDHGAQVVTLMVSKAKRGHKKFVGILGPGLGKFPMQGGRRSRVSKTMRNGLQPRLTLAQRHALFLQKRAIVAVEDFSEPFEVYPS